MSKYFPYKYILPLPAQLSIINTTFTTPFSPPAVSQKGACHLLIMDLSIPARKGYHRLDQDKKYSPGFVNPSLDSIFFRMPPAACESPAYKEWFDQVEGSITGGLNRFQELEIRDVW